MDTKRCTKCGRELPLSEFGKMKTEKNGLSSWCRECNRAIAGAWAKAHPERCRERLREYRRKKKEKRLTLAAREREEKIRHFSRDILGGWRAYVLNYARGKEKRFNVVSTAGEMYATDDKESFLRFLRENI